MPGSRSACSEKQWAQRGSNGGGEAGGGGNGDVRGELPRSGTAMVSLNHRRWDGVYTDITSKLQYAQLMGGRVSSSLCRLYGTRLVRSLCYGQHHSINSDGMYKTFVVFFPSL